MHLVANEAILVTTASLSFASLLFLGVYLIFLEPDESAKQSKDGGKSKAAAKPDFAKRPSFIGRAIGDDKIGHLRAFRTFDHIFATLPTAYRVYRKRLAEERTAQARNIVDVATLHH